MPSGLGFWYCRRNRRYYLIDEHATDAVGNPSRFRSRKFAHLNPVVNRELIVRGTAAQGFIRVRYWRLLGFEFHGDPDSALKVLRRFIRRHGIGNIVLVNMSDFASGISKSLQVSEVLAAKSARELGFKTYKKRGK